MSADVLSLFHPLIAQWFSEAIGAPTDIQTTAWPEIAAGYHVLVAAPTGTGKTLAAFLWGIDRLVTAAWSTGKVRILYVSPLKALNNDIQRNLLAPLSGLADHFSRAGSRFPEIRVLTRSGDTSSSERRRMLAHPPEILITTPESLNLILSSPNARLMLDGLATVILDEIHAVAATKRGTHLGTAVERLVRLSGEFQRIALSATARPLSVIADLVGGYSMKRGARQTIYQKRSVRIMNRPLSKQYDLSVAFPVAGTVDVGSSFADEKSMWVALAQECRRIIAESHSTLFFVNSRRHAEKLSRFINEGFAEPLAWSHHGSLSRELRLVVEQRLKNGELKAIVATSSLELGIDIGALDRVILVQTPLTVASAVQRLGRAGHAVGKPSRGVIFPLHGKDIVDAAVMARCIREQDIEEMSPVLCPLDVLAQLVVSMTAAEEWNVDELFDCIRSSYSYHTLPRRHFDLVLDMLTGKYEQMRVRELSTMVSFDRLSGQLNARESTRMRLAMGGGTIPDRGYFVLRTADSKALLGELDEEFVWERAVGDSFIMGTQGWRIQKIDHQSVEVVPAEARAAMYPFWKAEERNRTFHVSDRIARAMEDWNGRLWDESLPADLAKLHGLKPGAVRAMIDFLVRQREVTGRDLPHRHHLLVEHTRDPQGSTKRNPDHAGGERIVLHTLWGGKVNRPFSLALSAAWEEKLGYRPQIFQDDDTILLLVPDQFSGAEILSLVTAGNVERLLRARLSGSGFFGARFREAAGRALLLPRVSSRGRTPLWVTRLRAKGLLAAVTRYEEFPLVLEAWRTCLQEEFDLPDLAMVLGELASGTIAVDEAVTLAPSPLCGSIAWKETNALMYADDTPAASGAGTQGGLRAELVRELALSAKLRPSIRQDLAVQLQAKLQRTAEGYAPRNARELLDWLKDRVLVPRAEWEELLFACVRDAGYIADTPEHSGALHELREAMASRIVEHTFGDVPTVIAAEIEPRLHAARENESDEILGKLVAQWLRYYGPIPPAMIGAVVGLGQARLDSILDDLVQEEELVIDTLLAGSEETLVCDRENLEALLRISRVERRTLIEPLPPEMLPYFVAERQGLVHKGTGLEDMKDRWERLFGLCLPARLWEEEVFPARLSGYSPRWLDTLFQEAGLLWFAAGKQRIGFCFGSDAELFAPGSAKEHAAAAIIPSPTGKYGFWDLVNSTKLDSAKLTETLWDLAWKGEVSADSFQPVRKGISSDFKPGGGNLRGESTAGGRVGRGGFARWQSSRPAAGSWFLLSPAARSASPDALDREEDARDRIRQVLLRYGIVFREILEQELTPMKWSSLFRSLRLMEFSGEVVAGMFFKGVRGLQFASPSVLESLAASPSDTVFWMNAADPASLCGVGLESLKEILPPRLATTHLVFHGPRVVLVARRMGRDLEFRVPPEEPRIGDYMGFARELTSRDQRPLPAVHVLSVNGEPVGKSPYRAALIGAGFVEDYRRLSYRARA
jgi:ATP-dependent Lhr-like helicase